MSRWIATAALLWAMGCSGSGPVNYVEPGAADAVDAAHSSPSDILDEPRNLDDAFTDDDREEPDSPSADLHQASDLKEEPEATAPETVESDLSSPLDAHEDETTEPDSALTVELVDSHEASPWAEVRLYEVDHPGLGADKFIDRTSRTEPALAAWFGGETQPSADHFLLHIGPHCGPGAPRAVLLVHGAGGDADSSFVDPGLSGGLATDLMAESVCAMAVTFPHPFGDNYNQAVQLAGALKVGCELTLLEKLDVVAHSKGGIVALALAGGLAASEIGLDYDHDMRSLSLLGVPVGGMDFSFRHPAFNYPVELYDLAMPSSWDKILEWGSWKDVYDESIYGGAFDGILQMLTAWDEAYALSMFEQDWYTTYYGGDGFVSHSLGIAKAIEMGGSFMARLHDHALPADLPVALVSGGNALIGGMIWEGTGPSDGLVFEDSATDDSLCTGPLEKKHFALLNHWDLLAKPQVRDWVSGYLLP